jgi:hypothetical protein
MIDPIRSKHKNYLINAAYTPFDASVSWKMYELTVLTSGGSLPSEYDRIFM